MEKTQSLLQTVQRFFKIALRLNDRHLFIRKLLKFKRFFYDQFLTLIFYETTTLFGNLNYIFLIHLTVGKGIII